LARAIIEEGWPEGLPRDTGARGGGGGGDALEELMEEVVMYDEPTAGLDPVVGQCRMLTLG